jgi:hypothetical protein
VASSSTPAPTMSSSQVQGLGRDMGSAATSRASRSGWRCASDTSRKPATARESTSWWCVRRPVSTP